MIDKSGVQGCIDPYPHYPLPTYPSPNTITTWTTTKEVPVKIELYQETLSVLSEALEYVDQILGTPGVIEVEIRIRVDDMKAWAVLGYGESGDPCILRFEKD